MKVLVGKLKDAYRTQLKAAGVDLPESAKIELAVLSAILDTESVIDILTVIPDRTKEKRELACLFATQLLGSTAPTPFQQVVATAHTFATTDTPHIKLLFARKLAREHVKFTSRTPGLESIQAKIVYQTTSPNPALAPKLIYQYATEIAVLKDASELGLRSQLAQVLVDWLAKH